MTETTDTTVLTKPNKTAATTCECHLARLNTLGLFLRLCADEHGPVIPTELEGAQWAESLRWLIEDHEKAFAELARLEVESLRWLIEDRS